MGDDTDKSKPGHRGSVDTGSVDAEPPKQPRVKRHRSRITPFRSSVVEVGLILLLFFLFAGRPAPDVNEAHYLTKAKHYWQPDWCAGDSFLESDDAHLVFYWSTGWLTKFMPLDVVAWVGRVLTWLLLAAAWQRLVCGLVPNRGYSLLAAAIALCLWDRFHLAGEWVVGGFEAKGFSLVLLLVALHCASGQRWLKAYCALGAASAFHVLIGGWGGVALSAVLLFRWRIDRPDAVRVASGILGGGVLALFGLGPAIWLTTGADAAVKQAAAEIYVQRLSHHLEFYSFSPKRIWLFGVLLAVWGGLAICSKLRPKMQRVQCFVVASIGIGLIGVGLDYFSIVLPVVNRLLRFYWFRLSDVMVPIGVVLLTIDWLRRRRGNLALCIVLTVVTGTLTYDFWTSNDRRCSPAFIQGFGRELRSRELENQWRDWRDVCHWIDQRTPPNARCLTPITSQTFCWYANRPEVAVWKNIPQDARSIIAWREAMDDIKAANIYPKPNAISPPPVVDPTWLAETYQFQYLIATNEPSILWPEAFRNTSFVVYRNPRAIWPPTEPPATDKQK